MKQERLKKVGNPKKLLEEFVVRIACYSRQSLIIVGKQPTITYSGLFPRCSGQTPATKCKEAMFEEFQVHSYNK